MADDKRYISTNSQNPAYCQNINGIISCLIDYIGYTSESCMPAIITEYDRKTHKATVIPLVKLKYENGNDTKYVNRLPIQDVTVYRVQHGGFLIDIPVNKGDTGWLIAADRDSSVVKMKNNTTTSKDNHENLGTQIPSNVQYHKYQFGFFIPDRWGKIENIGEDSETPTMTIRSINGDSKIQIDVNGNVSISCKKTTVSSNSVIINGATTVNGSLSINGNTDCSGDVTASGISLVNHTHSNDGKGPPS